MGVVLMTLFKKDTPLQKAVYFLEDDDSATEHQSWVIKHAGAMWLVATWLKDPRTGTRTPERIVPLEMLGYVVRTDGLIRLGRTLPLALFAPDASSELLQSLAVALHPDAVNIPGFGSTH